MTEGGRLKLLATSPQRRHRVTYSEHVCVCVRVCMHVCDARVLCVGGACVVCVHAHRRVVCGVCACARACGVCMRTRVCCVHVLYVCACTCV